MGNVTEAVQLFKEGCACSQAIVAVYGPAFGIDRATALRIASGFAGGMRLGEVCGAVTGAFMVLGLKHGSADCDKGPGRRAVSAAVTEFATRFKKRHGAVSCRELLGCDISTATGMKQAQEKDLFRTVCPDIVKDAAEILEQMLSQSDPAASATD